MTTTKHPIDHTCLPDFHNTCQLYYHICFLMEFSFRAVNATLATPRYSLSNLLSADVNQRRVKR